MSYDLSLRVERESDPDPGYAERETIEKTDEIRVRLDQGSLEPRFTLRDEPIEGVVHFAIKGSPWDVRGTSPFIEETKVGEK